MRYITNKPKLNVTESNANSGDAVTAGGDPNSNINATINIPLIADTLAVRATILNAGRWRHYERWLGTLKSALGEAALRYPH